MVEMSCTNMDASSKVNNNTDGHNDKARTNTLINYFLSSPNVELDKRKSIEQCEESTMHLIIFLMVLGASKAHFPCSSNLIANHSKYH